MAVHRKSSTDDFSFKLKAYPIIMNIALKKAMGEVGENIERKASDSQFNSGHGNPRVELLEMGLQLQWILITRCTGPTSTFLRRKQNDEWIRKLGLGGAEVQDSHEGESR